MDSSSRLTILSTTLSNNEKLDFINAVKCLHKKPSRTPASVAPGAKSRFDDLVYTHIKQANNIHVTVSFDEVTEMALLIALLQAQFFTWHRYYIWTFEQMLRNECGYKGYLPYINWALLAEDPKSSPVFDGSSTSLSGDGEYVPGRNYTCFPFDNPCLMKLQPGTGGGCVKSGPFKE